LAGFALHVTSAVIAVNHELSSDKENAQSTHSKEIRSAASLMNTDARARHAVPLRKAL
jgi:hypothetical protein